MEENKKSQAQRFVDLAKKVEADEGEDAFDDNLKRIAKAPAPQKRSKTKGGKAPAKRG